MPKEFKRTDRVAEQLQREIAVLIQQELKDPRLGFVTISSVEVSRDLAHAKVFFTTIEHDEVIRSRTAEALNHAAGFLHNHLGRRLRMRMIPHLRFVYDDSAERGSSLSKLIDTAVASDQPSKNSHEDKSE